MYLATESVTNPNFKTGVLMKMLKDGRLEKEDPEHPLLYAITAVKNRHAITKAVKDTERQTRESHGGNSGSQRSFDRGEDHGDQMCGR